MESTSGQSQKDGEVQTFSDDPGSRAPGRGARKVRGETVLNDDGAGEAGHSGISRTERRATGYVYLIGPYKGCYKIGKAKDPESRHSGLCLPKTVKLLHVIASDEPLVVEDILHVAFAHRIAEGVHRCSVREWFRLDDAELAAILSVPFANGESDLPESVIALKNRNGSKGRANRLLPGGFMVRLPESFRELLDKLTNKSHRTMTVEVQLALQAHAKANGETPPEIAK